MLFSVASGNTSGSDSPHDSPASCTSPPIDLNLVSTATAVSTVNAMLAAAHNAESLFSSNHRPPSFHGNMQGLPTAVQSMSAHKHDNHLTGSSHLPTSLGGGHMAGNSPMSPGLPANLHVQGSRLPEQVTSLAGSGLSGQGHSVQGNSLTVSGMQRTSLGDEMHRSELANDIKRHSLSGEMQRAGLNAEMLQRHSLNAELQRSSLGGDLHRPSLVDDLPRSSIGVDMHRSMAVAENHQSNVGGSLGGPGRGGVHGALPPGLGLNPASQDEITAAIQASMANTSLSAAKLGVSGLAHLGHQGLGSHGLGSQGLQRSGPPSSPPGFMANG